MKSFSRKGGYMDSFGGVRDDDVSGIDDPWAYMGNMQRVPIDAKNLFVRLANMK